MGTIQFPIQSRYSGIRKIKETGNPLRRSGPAQREAAAKKSKDYAEAYMSYAAQMILKIDAEIAEIGHLWMETGDLGSFSGR